MKNKIIFTFVSTLGFLIMLSKNNAIAENRYFNTEILPYIRIDSGWANFTKTTAPNGANGNLNLPPLQAKS